MLRPDTFLVFTRKLEALRVPYMITGSVAAMFYGEPRLTNDVDLVVDLRAEDIPRILDAFPSQEFYRPPPETLRDELGRSRRGHFNLIHHATGFKADIYLRGSDPLLSWGLVRARRVDFRDDSLAVAAPEYVILKKLEFFEEGGSEKHLRDIQRMLLAMGDGWDRAVLLSKIQEQGLEKAWARVLGPAVP